MHSPASFAAPRIEELLGIFGAPQACVAELLCDRHPHDSVAFTLVGPDRVVDDLTYGEIQERSRRFAAALSRLGVGPGDRVATLMGKSADLVAVLVGIWRRGAVHVPLFTAFAAPAVAYRLKHSKAKVVIVDAEQAVKLHPDADMPADPPWTVVVAQKSPVRKTGQWWDLSGLLDAHDPLDPGAAAQSVGGEAELARLYTSGTTGTPKGVPPPEA